jgi:pimeloyl-ACP methyl ester carboxylesterase
MKKSSYVLTVLTLIFLPAMALGQDTLKVKDVEAILFAGKDSKGPLVVGLGGSEGGNAWASERWKGTREQFLAKGYAFLALGYFGSKGTPKLLDGIAIDGVYAAIAAAKRHERVDSNLVAVIGGSRGADLALLLASYYPDIDLVVGMSASHAVFPGHTQHFTSSCWTFKGQGLSFIPVNDAAVPFLMKGELRGTFSAMMRDSVAEQKALIKVERIKGPILLLSADRDEVIPAVEMADKMMARLKAYSYPYPYQHIVYQGSHAEPTKHFEEVLNFLDHYFLGRKQ